MVRHRSRGWELPGGRLEDGEDPVLCARREFHEETGHLLDSTHFVAELRRANGTCYLFTGVLGTKVDEVDAMHASVETRWFERLPRADRLAFPDDSYDSMGKLLGIAFR